MDTETRNLLNRNIVDVIEEIIATCIADLSDWISFDAKWKTMFPLLLSCRSQFMFSQDSSNPLLLDNYVKGLTMFDSHNYVEASALLAESMNYKSNSNSIDKLFQMTEISFMHSLSQLCHSPNLFISISPLLDATSKIAEDLVSSYGTTGNLDRNISSMFQMPFSSSYISLLQHICKETNFLHVEQHILQFANIIKSTHMKKLDPAVRESSLTLSLRVIQCIKVLVNAQEEGKRELNKLLDECNYSISLSIAKLSRIRGNLSNANSTINRLLPVVDTLPSWKYLFQYEQLKLLHKASTNDEQFKSIQYLQSLCSQVASDISESSPPLLVKMYNKLSIWSHHSNKVQKYALKKKTKSIAESVEVLRKASELAMKIGTDSISSSTAVKSLLHFANFSFKLGISQLGELSSTLSKPPPKLTVMSTSEKQVLSNLLHQIDSISAEQTERLMSNLEFQVFQSLLPTDNSLEIAAGMGDSDQNERENAMYQIKNVFSSEDLPLPFLKISPANDLLSTNSSITNVSMEDMILEWWFSVRGRFLKPFKSAANSYFHYLYVKQTSDFNSSTSDNTTSTLQVVTRLTTLLLRFGRDLADIYEHWIPNDSPVHSNTKFWSDAWFPVLPIIYSRANHRDPIISNFLQSILFIFAHQAPHLIIYPTIVASRSKLRSIHSDQIQKIKYAIEGGFKKLIADHQLVSSSPSQEMGSSNFHIVEDVESIVVELNRISILWDEQWFSLLHHFLLNELSYKFKVIKHEVSSNFSLNSNSNGFSTLIVQERLHVLKRTYAELLRNAITEVNKLMGNTLYNVFHRKDKEIAKTPHEIYFIKTYADGLKKAAALLSDPFFNVQGTSEIEIVTIGTKINQNLDLCLQIFKEISKEMNKQIRGSTSTLKMESISPFLLSYISPALNFIPMPGLTFQGTFPSSITSVHKIESSVKVLPTKTRPKKMNIIGNDGVPYTYLLKGGEDLRLDERMMQFLTTVNKLLATDKSTYSKQLRARNYAVIPLSENSGLVQWVNKAVPIYTLYKQWFKRDTFAKNLANSSTTNPSNTSSSSPSTVSTTSTMNTNNMFSIRENVRPSEIYFAKLVPALKEKGISVTSSRKDWPIDVMKRVFTELQRETPNSLISRDIWSKSSSNADYFKRNQSFSRSVAVMSILGYILGLGDRHLDNILLDSSSSEVIHVDYNVCFEKGLKLKVPEKVAFRLTQNFQAAVNLSFPITHMSYSNHQVINKNLEGTFIMTCEDTLRVMRKNKEYLVSLLLPFVYDPLVDWSFQPIENTKFDPSEEQKKIEDTKRSKQKYSIEQKSSNSTISSTSSTAMEVHVRMSLFSEKLDELSKALVLMAKDALLQLEGIIELLQTQSSSALAQLSNFIKGDYWILYTSKLEEINQLIESILEVTPNNSNIRHVARSLELRYNNLQEYASTIPAESALLFSTDLSPFSAKTVTVMNTIKHIPALISSLAKTSSRYASYASSHSFKKSDENLEDTVSPTDVVVSDESINSSSGDSNASIVFQSNSNSDVTPNDKNEPPIVSEKDKSFGSEQLSSFHLNSRNLYAITALQRLQTKLQGMDKVSTKMEIKSQINKIVLDATHINNLCVLYEGWTAWV